LDNICVCVIGLSKDIIEVYAFGEKGGMVMENVQPYNFVSSACVLPSEI